MPILLENEGNTVNNPCTAVQSSSNFRCLNHYWSFSQLKNLQHKKGAVLLVAVEVMRPAQSLKKAQVTGVVGRIGV